tara:strand:- start:6337 stop:6564 length:228 start_codon:yes stop_codon:yes gene_type:complete
VIAAKLIIGQRYRSHRSGMGRINKSPRIEAWVNIAGMLTGTDITVAQRLCRTWSQLKRLPLHPATLLEVNETQAR